jgi:hypothetical protein
VAAVRPPGEAAATKPAPATEEPPEKAYVAPQVLPKPLVPSEAAPDAKVVLNLPAEPVAAVSEAEVRAARARRRTATVKIDRAHVLDNLKMGDVAGARPAAEPTSDRPRKPAPAATAPAPGPRGRPMPDGEEVTPLARQLRSNDASGLAPRAAVQTPLPRGENAVATSREIDLGVDDSVMSGIPRKSNSGLIVGLAALAVVAAGGYYVVQNVLPNTSSPSSAAVSVAAPPAPTPSPPPTATENAALPTAESPVSAPVQSVASPAPPPPRNTARPPPRAAAPPPPRPPPPPAPRPAVKPTKSGDIPSEI